MAHSGLELGDPLGERILFLRTSAETGGELLEVEVTYGANSPQPPAHYHPRQSERFTVLSGRMRTCIGGVEREYSKGESFEVGVGVVHWMHNAGEVEARVRWETRPALRTERLLEAVFGLIQDGKIRPGKAPSPLMMAPILMAHRDEIRLSSPPEWVQAVVFPFVRVIAGWAGYGAEYDARVKG